MINLTASIQIGYESTGIVQMTFLRLLYEEVRQNFTYTCINSIAWYNAKVGNHDLSIKLMDESEEQFSINSLYPVAIVHDGCKVRDSFLTKIF